MTTSCSVHARFPHMLLSACPVVAAGLRVVHRLPPESPAARRRQQPGQHPLRALQAGAFSAHVRRTRSSLGVYIRPVLCASCCCAEGCAVAQSRLHHGLGTQFRWHRRLWEVRFALGAPGLCPGMFVIDLAPLRLVCALDRCTRAAVRAQSRPDAMSGRHRLIMWQNGWEKRDRQVRIALR